MPPSPGGAEFELGRESALGNLAVDGGSGQPGPGKDGFEADDTVWLTHGCAASCWLFLTAAETRQGKRFTGAQEGFPPRRSVAKSRRQIGRVKFRCPGLGQGRCRG